MNKFVFGIFALAFVSLTATAAMAEGAWYEGGTLQKAIGTQWMKASAANQLASSADFMAAISGIEDVSKVKDIEPFKARAVALKDCINKTLEEEVSAQDKKVAEIVLACTLGKNSPDALN